MRHKCWFPEHVGAKPEKEAHFDYHALLDWLAKTRPSLIEYVEERCEGEHNGQLLFLDVEQSLADMKEFPDSYSTCGYLISDLEWLQEQIGTPVAVHYSY